jgi:hypothetical protein
MVLPEHVETAHPSIQIQIRRGNKHPNAQLVMILNTWHGFNEDKEELEQPNRTTAMRRFDATVDYEVICSQSVGGWHRKED